jgi:hypothetical protein
MADPQKIDIAEILLGKLFDRWQSALGQPARAITLCISGRDGKLYFETKGDARRLLHATLENAEKVGAIELKKGKHAASHELDQILLIDGEKLAVFLGKQPAATCVAKLENDLNLLLRDCAHDWITEAYRDACYDWRRGKAFRGLSLPQDHVRACQLFQALLSIAEGKHKGLDMRTFSARNLSDSKAFERLKSSFCSVWAKYNGLEEWDTDELLQAIGLEKEPHPVLLRGPLLLQQKEVISDLSCFQPYIGMPRELLGSVIPKHAPAYVLTIENLTSFFRHAREIQDDGLILFTNGFPNPDVQKLLGRLDSDFPQSIPFYHWGDTDVEGLRILNFIGTLTPNHTISSHLMSRKTWQPARLLNDIEIWKANQLRSNNVSISDLLDQLIIEGLPKYFEQENIDPASPLHATTDNYNQPSS